ncbi:MAG TPA: DUF1134 domain-containing protein [Halothiobacillus sp.]|nr:DUF1134 domain-containing protein [Halothiobacillus sp.]
MQSWLQSGLLALGLVFLAGCATTPGGSGTVTDDKAVELHPDSGYARDETTEQAIDFLGSSAEQIAKLIDRAFSDYGRPNAIIKGDEGSGSIVVGLRYGSGDFLAKSGARMPVYWQGPSIGWDFGADAGRVFILVYNLSSTDELFQRFAGVSGSAFFVGGAGMQYLRAGDVIVAPIRVGVGMRLGAAVGYMTFSPERTYNPF